MNKTSLLVLMMVGLLSTQLLWGQTPAAMARPPVPAPPQLAANSYLLMDFDSGQVLVSKQPDLQVNPASITKLMTIYVTFIELAGGKLALTDQATVSEKAWKTPGSRMFLEPNTQVSVEDLLKGIIIQSGNDACVALAEHIAGSEEAFVSLMNHYAGVLGLRDTQFADATGLSDQNWVTALDIAQLSRALIGQFPDYYTWFSDKEFTYNSIRQHNRNNLLWRDPAVDGLKTGHTDAAGYCLAASAKRENMRLISVVLGSASEATRASESQSLLNYGFRFYETVPLYQANTALASGEVWKGAEEEVQLGLAQDLVITIPRGRYEELSPSIEMHPRLTAPLNQGQVVGRMTISLDGRVLARQDLVTLAAVEQAGFFGRSWDGMRLWVGGLFGDDE